MIQIKKLNKPTGGKPGFVTYTGQKTLRVTPDSEKKQIKCHCINHINIVNFFLKELISYKLNLNHIIFLYLL